MLDPKEEKRFEELRGMCRELKVPNLLPEVKIRFQVHENDVLTFDDIQRGHSWTRNYWNFAWGMLTSGLSGATTFGAGYMTGKDTSGTITAGGGNYCYMSNTYTMFYHPYATAAGGIVLGTGDTAFSIDQYALAAIIAHGNSASQLYYQAMIAPPGSTYDAPSKTFSTTYSSTTVMGKSPCMMERSVLAPTVAVASGAQLTVTYDFSMDFSSID
jgi:hypothetical protein